MMMRRILIVLAGFAAMLLVAGCGSDSETTASSPSSPPSTSASIVKTANQQYCAHNSDPACPKGSYVGPFVSVQRGGGHWDASGKPVNGGPVGADGSTGNNLTQEYCARNQDPACPAGSYVGPDAIRNPDGSNTYVVCEGTICTNPNHGAGDPPGTWGPDGQPINGGPMGADGSTGNNLTHEYCARNQDPACPAGTYVGPNAMRSPDGSNTYVPCEGTICTNPNHGAGPDPNGPSGGGVSVAPPAPPAEEAPPADAPPADDDGTDDDGGTDDDSDGQDAPETDVDSP
ncbi:hypothetical protein [Mycolicibacterium agri]